MEREGAQDEQLHAGQAAHLGFEAVVEPGGLDEITPSRLPARTVLAAINPTISPSAWKNLATRRLARLLPLPLSGK